MTPAASQATNLTAEAHELISFCHRNFGAVEVSLFGEIGSGLVDFRDRLFYSYDKAGCFGKQTLCSEWHSLFASGFRPPESSDSNQGDGKEFGFRTM